MLSMSFSHYANVWEKQTKGEKSFSNNQQNMGIRLKFVSTFYYHRQETRKFKKIRNRTVSVSERSRLGKGV